MNKKSPYENLSLQEKVDIKRKRRMDKFDQFDPEIRTLINDYGLAAVTALRDVGVTKPKHIRHVVETILDEFSPTRGTGSLQGIAKYKVYPRERR